MTDILIKHQCPQCGAPVTLAETDRLVSCGFCRVRSYLLPQLFFRYMLPHTAPEDKRLVYVPYWRYKGMLFFATDRGMQERFIDASRLAVDLSCVPASLGVRSQAMTLHFVTPETPGRFITPEKPFTAVSGLFDSIAVPTGGGTIFHQTDIGEAVSLIYAPFYGEKGLHDAVLNRRLGGEDKAEQLARLPGGAPTWKIRFLPTLCPGCGWDMEGQRDSLALICRNCDSVWRAGSTGLKRTRYASVPDDAPDVLYLPFWRFKAAVSGIPLESYADLVRIANLPRVVQPDWERQPFRFWSLAFKVRPKTFLQLSLQMNLGQPSVPTGDDPALQAPKLPKGNIHPVNLPVSEAVESLKISLASFIRPAKAMLPRLPDITITAERALLIYLPFREGPHEYTNDAVGVTITKQHIALAGNL
ncbi:MAG: hypothetical protein ABIL58_09985 [Pseudomonadota bacterium]